jgi:diguanylate cyclase (GGDEF)-like protein
MPSLVAFALLTLAAVPFVILSLAVSKLNRRIRTLEAAERTLEHEFAAARAKASEMEAAQQFLARFVRELPGVVHGLLLSSGGRNIPGLLLSAITRMVEPRRAIVAVRRRPAETDPDRHTRLAVAAVYPEGFLELGHEIPIGTGELGYAAEEQRVMDRKDFDAQQPHMRKKLREETSGGFQPDIVAPMVVDQEVVGVVAVEGLKRRASDVRDALRLLAQVGAVSVHTQARYTEMKATASVDGLTGAFNKRYLTHRLAEELTHALEESKPLSVFLFDVDHFKRYNDQNGHVAGDRLLQSLAKLVQDNLRRNTIFGRYGGEEFLIVFPNTKREQAMAAAENVRAAIAAYPFAHAASQPLGYVSISGGVAECPLDERNAVGLVRAADEALYRAKRSGRNRVLAHEPVYLGDQALEPVAPAANTFDPLQRAAMELRARREAPAAQLVALEPGDTPQPGTLLSLAAITPPAGIPSLAMVYEALNDALQKAGASPETPAASDATTEAPEAAAPASESGDTPRSLPAPDKAKSA